MSETKIRVKAVRIPKDSEHSFSSYYAISAETPKKIIDKVLKEELDSYFNDPILFIQLTFEE